ncbi:probable voltage-gated potassium channel subunit beta [Dendrobium catenatum]|uniref:probable voltage-gated potassium channel subunit beta n=1 Tax=Dendrobium catenatum TaxID=906689 RepID=UPI0010A04AC8|nr:probable voltage-gated potassium channel subunit beta [Dendrobium catenatum]
MDDTAIPKLCNALEGKEGVGDLKVQNLEGIASVENLANRSIVDDVLGKVNGLKPIGVTLAQLAIAWCASNPNVSSVITCATKESQVTSLYHFIKHVKTIFNLVIVQFHF